MKRITSACLLQTIRFDTASWANPEEELELYCRRMEKRKTRYTI